MPRQTFWLATIRGHHVNIQIAGVLTAEGDPFSVRREMRIRSLAFKAGTPPSHAARAWHHPNILRIGDRDLRRTDCWRTQQTGTAIRCLGVRFNKDVPARKPDAQEADSESCDGQEQNAAAELRLQGVTRHQFSSR